MQTGSFEELELSGCSWYPGHRAQQESFLFLVVTSIKEQGETHRLPLLTVCEELPSVSGCVGEINEGRYKGAVYTCDWTCRMCAKRVKIKSEEYNKRQEGED